MTVSSKPQEAVDGERLETPKETLINSILQRENELLREQIKKLEIDKEEFREMLKAEQEKNKILLLEDKRSREGDTETERKLLNTVKALKAQQEKSKREGEKLRSVVTQLLEEQKRKQNKGFWTRLFGW